MRGMAFPLASCCGVVDGELEAGMQGRPKIIDAVIVKEQEELEDI
jgi:hypothetical protein